MSERDELAVILEDEQEHGNWASTPDADLYGCMADAILAAGYRRPRTVTTTDELAALAVGSVVLHNGRAFQHYPEHPAPFDEYKQWKCADGGFVRSTKDGSSILPATVLHEPEATK